MPIQVRCACGQTLNADDSQAGYMVQCPRCGAGLRVPTPQELAAPPINYAGPGMQASNVRAPSFVPDNLRQPGLPVCYLVFMTDGAAVNAKFDASPALDSFVEGFARKLKKKFDVQITNVAPDAAPCAIIRLLRVEEGNRWLRYFLTLLAGATVLEIDGEIRSPSGQRAPFAERHKGSIGLVGGDSLGLLKTSGKYLGGKIAKKLMKLG
jgi:hypothetical protein